MQSFSLPCEPCGMDGGIGMELLFDALVEPDVDQDGLGDESQDPDGGGLGMDWEDDWFEDFEEGDELDEDFGDDASPPASSSRSGSWTQLACAAAVGRCCSVCRKRDA